MIAVRSMTVADTPLGLKLARQAGWNQIETDWRRFLALQPDGCFVGELDGASVATTAAFTFGPVAWLAMVLVDIDSRRRGVATALLKHALDFLDRQGVRTVRLDATAAGQPVYEKLGFVPEYPLTRYMGTATPWRGRPALASRGHPGLALPNLDVSTPLERQGQDVRATEEPASRPSALTLPPSTHSQWDAVVAFDERVTATPRGKMLARLFEESPELTQVLCRDGQVTGYVTGRRGAHATLIGPCIADDDAGPDLLQYALARCAGQPVFLDIPQDNAPATALAQASGLTAQRHFMRMCRGEQIHDHVESIWASSGAEKG
ncbi:MAG: GNAT family N-acetyltransferase [Planctomycetes bacterium]|jgi:GNAT superfamily N-acetyltransferase|nr:GNAT family N-acetyltransferase [Planctomycetota bacterium]